MEETISLLSVYSGWNGYQVSLVNAIAPLSQEQLAYCPCCSPNRA